MRLWPESEVRKATRWLRNLNHMDEPVRRHALGLLRDLGPRAPETISRAMRRERRIRRAYAIVLASALVFMVWAIIQDLNMRKGDWVRALYTVLVGPLYVLAYWFGIGKAAKGSAEYLTRLDDTSVVPTILELVAIGHYDNSIGGSLAKMLPRLTVDELSELTPEQRSGLIQLLDKRRPDPLRLGALSLLSEIGQPADIPKIEASCIAGSPDESIKNSAAECIEHIRQRDHALEARAGLLTPAGQPESVNALLRPAASTAMDESALLRPVAPVINQRVRE